MRRDVERRDADIGSGKARRDLAVRQRTRDGHAVHVLQQPAGRG